MIRGADPSGANPGRRPPPRLLRARRRLRAGLLQLLCAGGGLVLGLALPRVRVGPEVEGGQVSELLFTLGLGVIGVVTIVFSLLFSVVQWSASAFTPRLNLFREDPLVWRTFALAVGSFVYAVTAGLVSGTTNRVSALVPIAAVLAVLLVMASIRALQTRALHSLHLGHVLAAVTARGRAVIGDLYPLSSSAGAHLPPRTALGAAGERRTVTWAGPPGVVQQLDLRRLVNDASRVEAFVVFRVGVGDTLHDGSPLADLHGGALDDRAVRATVVRGTERSFDQDPMLALRVLSDIALRALSPAVYDPATAVEAVDATEGLLRALAARTLDLPDVTDAADQPRIRLVLPTWEDYLRTGVEDLIPAAATAPMVLERLDVLLDNVLKASPAPRHPPLLRLRARVHEQLAADREVRDLPQAPQ